MERVVEAIEGEEAEDQALVVGEGGDEAHDRDEREDGGVGPGQALQGAHRAVPSARGAR